MRTIVYAIAKNEKQNVEQFMSCAKHADDVYVLVNNSDDGTAEALLDAGALVYVKDYQDFRFDVARNDCLKFVKEHEDKDTLCLYLDLDEFLPPHWMHELEQIADETIDGYNFKWYWENNGSPFTFTNTRAHKLYSYEWKYPVHEVLVAKREVVTADVDITVSHYPLGKERNYLPLLQLAYQEDPEDLRNVHYLGRELLYIAETPDANSKQVAEASIGILQQYVARCNVFKSKGLSVWKAELSQIHIYIARAYTVMENWWATEKAYLQAITEFPETREPYMELAQFYLKCLEHESALGMASTALRINTQPENMLYKDVRSWKGLPYHIKAVCYNELGAVDKAKEAITTCLDVDPSPESIQTYAVITGSIPDNLEKYGLKLIQEGSTDEDTSTGDS